MGNHQSQINDVAKIEQPKFTIDLSAIFGMLPISLDVPIPKIPNPFSADPKDPLGLPYRKWRIRLRGWIDGRRGIPCLNTKEKSAFEDEIEAHVEKKISSIEKDAHEYRLALNSALESAKEQTFDVDSSISAIKSRFTLWMSSYLHFIENIERRHSDAKKEQESKQAELNAFMARENINIKYPAHNISSLEFLSEIIIIAALDAFLSFWFIQNKTSLDSVARYSYSIGICCANVVAGYFLGRYVLRMAYHSKVIFNKIMLWGLSSLFIMCAVFGNIKYAAWRDSVEMFSLNIFQLSAISTILLLLTLTVFSLSIFKSFKGYNPLNIEHKILWYEFSKAKSKAEEFRGLHELAINQMKESASAGIENIRDSIANYLMGVKRIKTDISAGSGNIKANISFWNKIIGNLFSFADATIKLYRECSAAKQKKFNKSDIFYPECKLNEIDFFQKETDTIASEAIACLINAEKDLNSFQTKFENDVVPDFIKRIENKSSELKIN